MSATTSAEVLIVGAGVIGSAIAYYLAREGVDVLVVDRARFPEHVTASVASAGGVRQQGRKPPERPLAKEAIDMWAHLEAELGSDLGYFQGGNLSCIDNPDRLPDLRARVEKEQLAGLNVLLVTGDEARELAPGISPSVFAATYCPTDGHADPIRTTFAFGRAARRSGARFLAPCTVTGIRRENGRVVGAETSEGFIACETLVLATGPWSHRLAGHCGFALPMLEAKFRQMMVTTRVPRRLDPVIGWADRPLTLKQVETGGFVIGGGWPGSGALDEYRSMTLPETIPGHASTVLDLYPALAKVPVIRTWVGVDSFSTDGVPIITALPEAPGMLVVTGFTAHGFALSPAVGRRTAEWIQTGKRPAILEPFDIGRFRTGVSA